MILFRSLKECIDKKCDNSFTNLQTTTDAYIKNCLKKVKKIVKKNILIVI